MGHPSRLFYLINIFNQPGICVASDGFPFVFPGNKYQASDLPSKRAMMTRTAIDPSSLPEQVFPEHHGCGTEHGSGAYPNADTDHP